MLSIGHRIASPGREGDHGERCSAGFPACAPGGRAGRVLAARQPNVLYFTDTMERTIVAAAVVGLFGLLGGSCFGPSYFSVDGMGTAAPLNGIFLSGPAGVALGVALGVVASRRNWRPLMFGGMLLLVSAGALLGGMALNWPESYVEGYELGIKGRVSTGHTAAVSGPPSHYTGLTRVATADETCRLTQSPSRTSGGQTILSVRSDLDLESLTGRIACPPISFAMPPPISRTCRPRWSHSSY